jgi:hypothetical protein
VTDTPSPSSVDLDAPLMLAVATAHVPLLGPLNRLTGIVPRIHDDGGSTFHIEMTAPGTQYPLWSAHREEPEAADLWSGSIVRWDSEEAMEAGSADSVIAYFGAPGVRPDLWATVIATDMRRLGHLPAPAEGNNP